MEIESCWSQHSHTFDTDRPFNWTVSKGRVSKSRVSKSRVSKSRYLKVSDASQSNALIVAPHRDPTQSQLTFSSEALKPIYMKDRRIESHLKIPTMQCNKNYLFRMDFWRKRKRHRQRQRQRQRMKKTQHVLYFQKAGDARIWTIFGSFLTTFGLFLHPFWTIFGPFFGPFLDHFWIIFGPF